MLNLVEHKKSFITSGPGLILFKVSASDRVVNIFFSFSEVSKHVVPCQTALRIEQIVPVQNAPKPN